MKNIIILGPPRTGKSTLSSIICKEFKNIHYISGDSIRNAFIKIYPELGFTSKNTINKIDFCNFIKHIIDENNIHLKRNIYYVIDSSDITLSNAINIFKNSIIIVLGCTDISEYNYKELLKKYDTELEWTYNYSDEKLLEICSETIESSRKLSLQCQEYNIKYFDTSKNRQQVYDEILDFIKEEFINE
ncbi:MAG: hypothetical protein IJE05_01575 [Clostridia bacterium]|nr:hypothetical protein [Clostridia bacterium]